MTFYLFLSMFAIILSFFDFFQYYSGSDLDNAWEVLFIYGWESYDDISIFLSFIILIVIFLPIIYTFLKAPLFIEEINKFPSLKEALFYYREKKKIERLSIKASRDEKAKNAKKYYQQKLAELEEEKKKFL